MIFTGCSIAVVYQDTPKAEVWQKRCPYLRLQHDFEGDCHSLPRTAHHLGLLYGGHTQRSLLAGGGGWGLLQKLDLLGPRLAAELLLSGLLNLELDGDHLGWLPWRALGLAQGCQLVPLEYNLARQAAQNHVALPWGASTRRGLLEDQGDAF